MSQAWIVPGAPLENGEGWRVWISLPGAADFQLDDVTVQLAGQAQPIATPLELLPHLEGLERRAGVLRIELGNPAPGKTFDITIQVNGESSSFRWSTLPDTIDAEGVTFLFGSCFWQNNDREGAFLRAVDFLTKKFQPSWKFLIGDQSYQDYPLVGPTNDALAAMASRYTQYWGDGKFLEALQATPNFFMCDDHEFWNDYPEKQIQLWQTRLASDKFGAAARSLYETFQSCVNPGQPWYDFKIGPVSFFVADTRSERDKIEKAPDAHFFKEPQWEALEKWSKSLVGPGVLVLGQPMFQEDGDWKDHSLSNFEEDYARLAAIIEDTQSGKGGGTAPHHILMLSGDIHTGRYSRATIADFTPGGAEERDFSAVHEFVASPSSLVGPYLPGRKPSISYPPGRLPVKQYNGTARPHWDIDTVEGASADNNIGLVRMSPGPADSVRFDLSLYRVRPFDNRGAWDRWRGVPAPQDTVQEFFSTSIKLS